MRIDIPRNLWYPQIPSLSLELLTERSEEPFIRWFLFVWDEKLPVLFRLVSNCWAQMIFLPQPPNGLSRIFEHNSSVIPSPPPSSSPPFFSSPYPLPLPWLPHGGQGTTFWSQLVPFHLYACALKTELRPCWTQVMLNSGHAELKGHAANAFTCPTSLHPSIIYKLMSKLSKLDSCIYQFNSYYYKIWQSHYRKLKTEGINRNLAN